MKPTQEQVIAWAREAGFGNEVWSYADSFMRLSELAYEAGLADENEACAKMFNDNESEILWGSQAASAIRARREQ